MRDMVNKIKGELESERLNYLLIRHPECILDAEGVVFADGEDTGAIGGTAFGAPCTPAA